MTATLHANDASIVAAVMNRYHGRHGRTFVGDLVDEYVQQFDGAPIQEYVEVLVIKEALDELRRLDGVGPVANTSTSLAAGTER